MRFALGFALGVLASVALGALGFAALVMAEERAKSSAPRRTMTPESMPTRNDLYPQDRE
jgi:hypothetical protein